MISKEQLRHRAMWVQKLESGELTQVTGIMTDGTGYCCLGVAELVMGHSPVVREDQFGTRYQINEQVSVMSRETAFDLGFLAQNPRLWVVPTWLDTRIREYENASPTQEWIDRSLVSLSFLNDHLGLSFQEIANLIRVQPENWTGVPLNGEVN